MTSDATDDRCRRSLDLAQQLGEATGARRLALLGRALLQVRARAEGRTFVRDDDGADLGIGVGAPNRLAKALDELVTERIAILDIRQGCGQDAAVRMPRASSTFTTSTPSAAPSIAPSPSLRPECRGVPGSVPTR